MIKFLYITKNFPPEIGGGIRRIQTVYNLLNNAENLQLSVVSGVESDKSEYKNVRFVRQLFFKDNNNTRGIRFINSRSKIKLIDKALLGWVPNVLSKIIFKKYDFVYAACPSFSNIIAGFIYKILRFLKPKLIIEYRDFFSFNPSYLNNFNKKICRFIEMIVIKTADYIIVTTESMKKVLSKIKDSGKIFVIKNYTGKKDMELIKELKKIDFKNNFYNLGYIGRLNTGRNPEKLLDLLNIDICGRKNALHFIGINNDEKEWIINTCKKLDYDHKRIFFENEVDRIKSLQYMKSFDALLVIVNNETPVKDGYGIPGKIYDYIACNNSIISDKGTFDNLSAEFDFTVRKSFANFINYSINDNSALDNVFNKTIRELTK